MLALILAALVVVLGASFAGAEESALSSILYPTSAVEQAAQAPSDAVIEGPSTDPQSAEELPHEDLGRDEARELLEGVFEEQLANPAGIFDELSVDRFLAPTVAVVDVVPGMAPVGEGQGELAGAALLDSTMPLRTESSSGEVAAVDLSLEASEGELRSVNPLVEVGIPREIGDGITLPGPGVSIELAGAPEERTASVVDQSVAFLPNVATDTDLVIAPTPTGVETLTHLRSADAPRTQTFDLDLPASAVLQATEDGGAIVRDDEGDVLVSVTAPTAIDAAGTSVPASLEVQGTSLILTAFPDALTQFPVLVDPLYQTYEWAKSNYNQSGICNSSFKVESSGSCNNREEWSYEHIENSSSSGSISLDNRVYGASAPVPQGTPGISIQTSGSLTAGDRGTMNYTVPRYFSDQKDYGVRPTSFIYAMKLSNLDWNAYSASLSPYLSAGIWDMVNGGWISYYTHEGLNGHGLSDMNFPYNFSNPANVNGKVAAVTVNATSTGPTQNTGVYVGNATIQLADNAVPTVGPVTGSSQWVNQTAKPITFTASDTGLGAHSLVATDEAVPPHSWKTAHGCIGVSGNPCPRQWKSTDAGSPALKYEPALMPQGVSYLSVVAEDPVGNKSEPAFAEVKVDHTKPSLTLSGTATEQASLGTNLLSYALKYDATDGESASPQSGVVSAQVKLDGQVVKTESPGCATKNCALLNKEWTLNADSYSAGTHNLEVIATDGVGLATTKSLTVETHGDLVAPTIAPLTASLTEQATLGKELPSYKIKISATDPGGAEERKSGVASVELKVDGQLVGSSAPGCPAGGCSLSKEWTLQSDSYAEGSHVAALTANDAAGRSTTKTVNFSIQRDKTAPVITANSNFFTAPEGWLEQKTYVYTATSSDSAGYGVTSMALKIDGKVVKSYETTCSAGGCNGSLGTSFINMTAYDGGAHPAELIAKDGAGNTAKKAWTINVDPNGTITLAEAEDTLEAVDETADSTLVAPTDETISPEERADGNDPSLVEAGGALESRGASNPSAIETDPEGGFTIVLPETTIEAKPVQVGSSATDVDIVEEVAGVVANVTPNVDLITRPLYSGLTTFANIRDATGSESFSWEVDLSEGQTLVSIDPMDVEIRFANGKRVMLIAAERAHDAVGTEVSTSLSVSEGNVLTLTVDHQGGSYIYPIVAGAGWEGGYTKNLIVGPKDEQEVKEEQERIEQEQQEALELTWSQEATGGEKEAPVFDPVPIDPSNPMGPKFLRINVGAPEMIDWIHRKRRSKANPAWCAKIECSVWNAEARATWYWNGTEGHPGGHAWRGDTPLKCYTDGAWWLDTDIKGLGWAGPNPAPYGGPNGGFLHFWCNFAIEYIGIGGATEDRYQLYSHLYGSGYEGVHIYRYPPEILEN